MQVAACTAPNICGNTEQPVNAVSVNKVRLPKLICTPHNVLRSGRKGIAALHFSLPPEPDPLISWRIEPCVTMILCSSTVTRPCRLGWTGYRGWENASSPDLSVRYENNRRYYREMDRFRYMVPKTWAPPTSILLSQIPRDLVHIAPKVKINLSPRKIPPKAIFLPEALRMKVVRFEIFRCHDHLTAIIDPRGSEPPTVDKTWLATLAGAISALKKDGIHFVKAK